MKCPKCEKANRRYRLAPRVIDTPPFQSSWLCLTCCWHSKDVPWLSKEAKLAFAACRRALTMCENDVPLTLGQEWAIKGARAAMLRAEGKEAKR
jgi:hypothetical protein